MLMTYKHTQIKQRDTFSYLSPKLLELRQAKLRGRMFRISALSPRYEYSTCCTIIRVRRLSAKYGGQFHDVDIHDMILGTSVPTVR